MRNAFRCRNQFGAPNCLNGSKISSSNLILILYSTAKDVLGTIFRRRAAKKMLLLLPRTTQWPLQQPLLDSLRTLCQVFCSLALWVLSFFCELEMNYVFRLFSDQEGLFGLKTFPFGSEHCFGALDLGRVKYFRAPGTGA